MPIVFWYATKSKLIIRYTQSVMTVLIYLPETRVNKNVKNENENNNYHILCCGIARGLTVPM